MRLIFSRDALVNALAIVALAVVEAARAVAESVRS